MTQWGKKKFYAKNRCTMSAWITNISEWWPEEVEGIGSPLPNIEE
jgi:hypothetical protein